MASEALPEVLNDNPANNEHTKPNARSSTLIVHELPDTNEIVTFYRISTHFYHIKCMYRYIMINHIKNNKV